MAVQPVSVSVQPNKADESNVVLKGRLSDESLVDENKFASNPFSNPKVAEHYKSIYENAKYECRRVFDPELEWEPAEEKKLVRKLDWHVCLWACIMFFALQVDRGNLSQAVSDNMLDQLGLNTNEFNYGWERTVGGLRTSLILIGNTIFRVSFCLAELPSQLISKRLGPDVWIPMQMTLWSVVASAQAGLTGKASFYACRSLLGILEGGFIPDLILWLSYFYTSKELPMRLSFFWAATSVTDIVTSLLAFALLHMDGIHGLAGWRWLFLIEGLITFAVGVAAFFSMPASAVQTKAWFRPNGWFTDREVGIVVNRVLRDDPSKGDMHNRMAITPKGLWHAMTDYDLWPIYAIGLIVFVPMNPPATYLTLMLRQIGFSTFNTNLLVIPSTAAGIFTLIGITWLSERVGERSFISMIQDIWTLPCIIALRWWPGTYTNAWGTYALVTVMLSYPYTHAIIVAWTSRNSGSVRTRSVSAALYNMMVQLGNVIAYNIYRADDKPLYHWGNSVLFGINVLSIALFLITKIYYVWKNRIRERKWNAMTKEQRQDYLDNTTDEGNKRLDFRFAH